MTELIIKVDDDFLREAKIKGMESQYELVRCKDCENYDKGENESESWEWCIIHQHSTSECDFCSWAKMKGGKE